MKPLMMMLALLFLGSMSVQAQSAKACCSSKDKTSCTKAEKASCDKTASAAKACCAKGEQGKSCAKSASSNAKKVSSNANVSTASIRIYGNCGMCKRTIEGALNEVEANNHSSSSSAISSFFSSCLYSFRDFSPNASNGTSVCPRISSSTLMRPSTS